VKKVSKAKDAKEQLREALEANGLSLKWSDWRDSQGFGQAVKAKAGIIR
jgi:hypothetical protein